MAALNASSVFPQLAGNDSSFPSSSSSSPETNGSSTNASTVMVSLWSCNHTGPLIMNENYPYPMLVEAARTLDVYEILQILAIAFVFAISVCGNLIIMIVVYVNSFLRSTINYYLVNLAVSDLLITLLCWPTITTQLTHPFYILGRPLCKMNVLTQTTCVTASVMTLSAVACDRLYAVMLPLRARSSAARPVTLILIIWVIAVILALPALLVRDVQVFQWDDLIEESCSDLSIRCSQKAQNIFRIYRILLTVALFFLPGIVMVMAYAVILLRLWCVKRPAMNMTSNSNAPPHPHIRAKRKIVKMTAMVLVAFLVCWSPLHILLFYDLICNGALPLWYDKVVFWAYFLGYCNSALNPLLYGGFSDNFRLGFRSLFKGRRSTCGMTSDHMQLPSTAMATSISVQRRSSRFTLQRGSRRSSLLQSRPATPTQVVAFLFKTDSNNSVVKSAPYQRRRSSLAGATPGSRKASLASGNPGSRKASLTVSQTADNSHPYPGRAENGSREGSSLSIHSQFDFCGTPPPTGRWRRSRSECQSIEEEKSFLGDKLKNDRGDSED